MSTKTTNLEMTLLAEEDNFDTNVYNENFQKTDDKIGELNSMLGSEELTTTSQTHSGAINELNKNLGVKVYSNLTSIGLTDANVTKEALYGAIPNYSRLSKAVWKSNWTSFNFPPKAGNYIVIEFTKHDAGYACVELYDLYNNKKYLSSYNGSSKAWSDWSALN